MCGTKKQVVDFSVTGISLALDKRFAPSLTMRKIFNIKQMKDKKKFTHNTRTSILNKQQNTKIRMKRLKRRFGQNLYGRYIPGPIVKEHIVRKPRSNLILHKHDFPRFTTVYEARGRRTLCEERPPDQTYNDIIRNIRAANTCEKLEALVQRQLNSKRVKLRTEQQQTQKEKHQQTAITRIGGNIRKCQKQQQSREEEEEEYNDIFTRQYMQLATEYYERGFLHNIKYLESIGATTDNNQRVRKRVKGAPEPKCTNTLTSSRINCCSIFNEKTKERQAQRECNVTTATVKATITATATNLCATSRSIESEEESVLNSSAWNAIRVKITPTREQRRFAANQVLNNIIKINNLSKHKNTKLIKNSMNDYLNANFMPACLDECNLNGLVHEEQQMKKQQQQQQQLVNNNQNTASLLADLANLDISSATDLHLPKITLTDCCSNYCEGNVEKTNKEIGAFILKQSRFNFNRFNSNSLDIPGEQNYHSEARPP